MKAGRSPPPPNGCSTTTMSSRSRSAKSATTCRRGYYRQLPKLADGPFAGYPARIRHRLGLRRAHRQPLRSGDAAAASCAPIRACSRSPSASCGRWRSRCASCWSRTCGASPQRIVSQPRRHAQEADARRRPAARRQRPRADPRRWRLTHAGAAVRRFAVQLVQRLRDQDPEGDARARWLEERPARGTERTPTSWCARSTSARARRTSRSATSSPACA